MGSKQPQYAIPTLDLLQAINANPDFLLTAEQAAAFLQVDVKWLAAAREGRKGINGPQYLKLGNGRTSPVRYRAGSLLAWVQALSTLETAVARTTSYGSYDDYIRRGHPEDLWLYVVDDASATRVEIFQALQTGLLAEKSKLRWLPHSLVKDAQWTLSDLKVDERVLRQILRIGNGDVATGIAAAVKALQEK